MSPYWDKVSNIAVIVHGAASETITITGLYGSPTITTNSDGNVNYYLPIGTFTFSGAISGQSFTRTVSKDTTEVYAMPEGALYWYGNECTDVTGGFSVSYPNPEWQGSYSKNTNNIKFTCSEWRHIKFTTKNTFNADKYNRLCVDANVTLFSNDRTGGSYTGDGAFECGLQISGNYKVGTRRSYSGGTGRKTQKVDYSSLEDFVNLYMYDYGTYATLYAIWLE